MRCNKVLKSYHLAYNKLYKTNYNDLKFYEYNKFNTQKVQ